MENEINRKNGLPVAGSTFNVYAEENATAVGYTDSINTTLNVIFADGKKISVSSNYYNLRNSVKNSLLRWHICAIKRSLRTK